MNTEEFGKMYLEKERNIEKVLRGLEIYDEDLMHDTYIALYLHSRHAHIEDFVNTFVAFYKARYKRRGEHESNYITCDDATMVEKFDRADESDLEYREQVGERVDELMARLRARPLPGDRNHQRTVKIMQLYREGRTFPEIGRRLKMSPQAVQQQFDRAIAKLRIIYRECERCEDEC